VYGGTTADPNRPALHMPRTQQRSAQQADEAVSARHVEAEEGTYDQLALHHGSSGTDGSAVRASVTIHVETLWTNRAELVIEAELDNPHSETNQQVVSMMFEAARLMAGEARGENERALFSQDAINERYRELDEREVRLDERDKRLTARETTGEAPERLAGRRNSQSDIREREQMEHDVHEQRRGVGGPT
jgi:hypothetical protein